MPGYSTRARVFNHDDIFNDLLLSLSMAFEICFMAL